MIVGLYPNHHSLPFWHSPQQPLEIFDPKRHRGRKIVCRDGPLPLNKIPMLWPVLMGLRMVDLPVMGHVSAFYQDTCDKKWNFPKRVWIQISTLPGDKDSNGIPIVVNSKGELNVSHLWGGDNGTYTPYQLLGKEPVPNEETPEFWRDFIIAKLRELQNAANQQAEKALQTARGMNALFAADDHRHYPHDGDD